MVAGIDCVTEFFGINVGSAAIGIGTVVANGVFIKLSATAAIVFTVAACIDFFVELIGMSDGSADNDIGTDANNGVSVTAGGTAAVVIAVAAGIDFFVEFIGTGDGSAAIDIGTDAHNGVSVAAGGTAAVVFTAVVVASTAVVVASTAVAGITVDTKNAEDVGIFSNEGIADDAGMIAADVDTVFNTGSFIDVAAVSFIDICPVADVASASGGGVCNHGAVVNPLNSEDSDLGSSMANAEVERGMGLITDAPEEEF